MQLLRQGGFLACQSYHLLSQCSPSIFDVNFFFSHCFDGCVFMHEISRYYLIQRFRLFHIWYTMLLALMSAKLMHWYYGHRMLFCLPQTSSHQWQSEVVSVFRVFVPSDLYLMFRISNVLLIISMNCNSALCFSSLQFGQHSPQIG